MAPLDAQSQSVIGSWRRFGEIGPVYEVIGLDPVRTTPNDVWMLIHVPDTDEQTGYRLAEILQDPAIA